MGKIFLVYTSAVEQPLVIQELALKLGTGKLGAGRRGRVEVLEAKKLGAGDVVARVLQGGLFGDVSAYIIADFPALVTARKNIHAILRMLKAAAASGADLYLLLPDVKASQLPGDVAAALSGAKSIRATSSARAQLKDLKKFAAELGVNVPDGILASLIEKTGTLSAARSVLCQLAENGITSAREVEAYVNRLARSPVVQQPFALVGWFMKAVFFRDVEAFNKLMVTLKLLDTARGKVISPEELWALCYWQIYFVAQLQAAYIRLGLSYTNTSKQAISQVALLLKAHPFRVQATAAYLKAIPALERARGKNPLAKILVDMLDLEIKIKRGQTDHLAAIESILQRILLRADW